MKKGLFEKSDDTRIIENTLRQCEVNEIVTYETLTKAIGRDVRKYGNLQSALRTLVKEGLVFDAIRNVGYKRLDDSGKIKKGQSYVRRSKASAHRSILTLEQVDYDNLTDAEKVAHNAIAMRAKAIELFGSEKSQKKIASKIEDNPAVLPVGETLKLFT